MMAETDKYELRFKDYDSGFCQANYRFFKNNEFQANVCAIDVMKLEDCLRKDLNWHSVSDPNGYAEPLAPLKFKVDFDIVDGNKHTPLFINYNEEQPKGFKLVGINKATYKGETYSFCSKPTKDSKQVSKWVRDVY